VCLALPGEVLALEPVAGSWRRAARVRFGGVVKQVDVSLVPEAREGDYVLVHVGVALAVVDEAEARRVFEAIREMGGLEELGDPAETTPLETTP